MLHVSPPPLFVPAHVLLRKHCIFDILKYKATSQAHRVRRMGYCPGAAQGYFPGDTAAARKWYRRCCPSAGSTARDTATLQRWEFVLHLSQNILAPLFGSSVVPGSPLLQAGACPPSLGGTAPSSVLGGPRLLSFLAYLISPRWALAGILAVGSSEDKLGSHPNSWKHLQGRICFDKRSLASSFPSPKRAHRFSDPVKLLLQKGSAEDVPLVLPSTVHPCAAVTLHRSKFCEYIVLSAQEPSQTSPVSIQPYTTCNRKPAASLNSLQHEGKQLQLYTPNVIGIKLSSVHLVCF